MFCFLSARVILEDVVEDVIKPTTDRCPIFFAYLDVSDVCVMFLFGMALFLSRYGACYAEFCHSFDPEYYVVHCWKACD